MPIEKPLGAEVARLPVSAFPLRERGGYLWFAHLQRMRQRQFRLSDFLGAPFAQERESSGAMQPSTNLSSALGRLGHQCG
jgi:hypothetical protein